MLGWFIWIVVIMKAIKKIETGEGEAPETTLRIYGITGLHNK